MKLLEKAFYLSVNVFSMKVPTGNTIFTSATENETLILRGHPSHAHEGQAVCSRLQSSSFISQLFEDPWYWSGPGN